MKKKKRNRPLTKEEILVVEEDYKKFVMTNACFGRRVTLKEDFYGIKKGTEGLVVDTWPNTSILFRGFYNEMMISMALSELLEFHEVVEGGDFDECYYTLSNSAHKKVTRKALISDD